jgi:acyl carrier protein
VNTIVAEIIEREFPAVGGAPPAEAHLRDDLGLDSMDIVRLQIVLEDRLGFRFDPNRHDLDAVFTTVGAIDCFLADHNLLEDKGHA